MKVEKIRLTDEIKENFSKGYVSNRHVSFTGTPYVNEDGDSVALKSYYKPTATERFGKWLSSIIDKFLRK